MEKILQHVMVKHHHFLSYSSLVLDVVTLHTTVEDMSHKDNLQTFYTMVLLKNFNLTQLEEVS